MTEEKSEAFPVAFVNPRSADNYVVGIVGTIGSGKSHLAMMLIKMWKFKFDIVVWISPTFQFQDMSMIRDTTGIVVFDKLSLENLKIIKAHQQARNLERRNRDPPAPPSHMLLVLDDNGMQARKRLQGGELDEILISLRHWKINIIQLAQRYTQLSPTLRANARYLIMFREHNPQERRNLYTYHGFGDKREFFRKLDENTSERYGWVGLECYPSQPRFFTASDGYLC